MSFPFSPAARGLAPLTFEQRPYQLDLFALLLSEGATPVPGAPATPAGPAPSRNPRLPPTVPVSLRAPLAAFSPSLATGTAEDENGDGIILGVAFDEILDDIAAMEIDQVTQPSRRPGKARAGTAAAATASSPDGADERRVSPQGAASSAARRLLDFRRSPDLGHTAACTWAVGLGAWGESLVRTRLLAWGYEAAEATPGASYDVAVHVPRLLRAGDGDTGPRSAAPASVSRFVRVQVKATLGAPDGSSRFHLRQGYRNTGMGSRPYEADAFDLIACVCLRQGVILFTSPGRDHISFSAGFVASMACYELEAFEAALTEIGALTPDERDLLAGPAWD